MIVKLWDETELVVTEAESQQIVRAISNKKEWLQIKGHTLRPSAIALIKPGGSSEVDRIPESRQIERPDHRGNESPAKERLRQWVKNRAV